ncbi:hypothetical protein FRC01_001842 [Tulasnella sp. 417]|nr:hypothetical protein FRC01_001842 [Tulasnella sp. 417]
MNRVQPVRAGDDQLQKFNAYNPLGDVDILHEYERNLLHQYPHIHVDPRKSFDSKHYDGRPVLNQYGSSPYIMSSYTLYYLLSGVGCQYKTYLNIYNDSSNPTASYKEMKWQLDVIVSNYWSTLNGNWGVSSSSPWGAQYWFLACATDVASEYLLYLQTGSDVPPGQNCTLTQIGYSTT